MGWDRVVNLILAGVLVLATVMMGVGISAMFGTNTRIDGIYPTLTQQARDVGEIKGDLRVAADRLDRASTNIEAIEAQLARTTSYLEDVARQTERAAAAQEAHAQRMEELVGAVRANSDALGSVVERLNQFEPTSSPIDLERQGMYWVKNSKWADIRPLLDESDITVVPFPRRDDAYSDRYTILRQRPTPLDELTWADLPDLWLVTSDPETGKKLRSQLEQR